MVCTDNSLEDAAESFVEQNRAPMSLNVLVAKAHEQSVKSGFWEQEPDALPGTYNKDRKFMLIAGEVSEAHEDLRKGYAMTKTYYEQDSRGNFKPCGIPSELADVIIRVMDLCGKEGIDLEAAVAEKMDYNSKRPYKHGKQF